jgi:uncharacterized repeat protein (TIGR01451 family)
LEPLEVRQLLTVDLIAFKSASPDPVVAGTELTYTISVTNGGGAVVADEPAQNVQLTEFMSPDTTFVSFTKPEAWEILTVPNVGETGFVEAILRSPGDGSGVVGVGETVFFTLVVRVKPGATGLIENIAGFKTAGTSDDEPLNDEVRILTPVSVEADLSITKTDNLTTVSAGSPVTYTIVVSNLTGPSDMIGANVLDSFSSNLTNVTYMSVAAGGATGNTTSGNSNINETVNLPVGSSITYTATGTVVTGATGTLSNTATVTPAAGTTDPNNANNSATDTTTILPSGPTTDLTITKTDGTTSVVPGNSVTYTILVTNAGLTDVTGATITDMFPAALTGVTYMSDVTGGATGNTASGNDNINDTVTMPAGSTITYMVTGNVSATATVTLSNTATVTAPPGTTDINPANNTSTDTDTLTPRANLSITKTDGATSSIPGSPVTYTIVVSNIDGPSAITGATITDTFPASITGVTYTSVPANGATGNTDGNGNLNQTVNLPVGSSITYTVNGTINPSATGTLSNTATIGVPLGATNTGISSATDTTTLAPTANLAISKTDGATTTTPGSTLTYTILVSNPGPSSVIGATVADTFQASLTNVSYTSVVTGGATGNTASGNSNISDVVNLPVGSSITYTVSATVSLTATGTITNTATITEPAGVTDPVMTNNTATDITAIPVVDLAVSKSDSPDPVIAGNNLTYTITVRNAGNQPLDSLQLTDTIPTGTTLVSFALPAGWERADSVPVGGTGQLRANRTGSLAADAAENFTLIVRVNPNTSATISNTATATTTTTGDVNSNNNSAAASTTVQTQADLAVTQSDSPDPVAAGGLITYAINVINSGPSNAQNVAFSDAIPSGTTFVSLAAPAGWNVTSPAPGGTGTVTGSIATLAAGITAPFTLIVRANSNLANGATITSTATVSTATNDANSSNNTAIVSTTVVVPPDFGDAPTSYGTLLANNGAQHGVNPAVRLGASIDSEANGQPTAAANGDDTSGSDDEDGVAFSAALIVNRGAAAIVNASAAARLDAWVDFNRNGIFDASEKIADNLPVTAGSNSIFFPVPADAVTGTSYARFRLSSAGGLGPTGPAADGEVEDYATNIIVVAPGTIGILPDPENPGQNMLSIVGTAANETIAVNQLRTHKLLVQVTQNNRGRGQFSMDDFRRIVVFAGAGNDTVSIGLDRPASLHGEAGNDKLSGGGGFDLLFGGSGNDNLSGGAGDDYLFGEEGADSLSGGDGNDVLLGGAGTDAQAGGKGHDLLIGGLGVDSLAGNLGDDILIGGTTTHDANRAALAAIMANWTAKDTAFPARVASLNGRLNSTTVVNDGNRDRLEGGSERDWYLDYLLADSIIGFSGAQDKKN